MKIDSFKYYNPNKNFVGFNLMHIYKITNVNNAKRELDEGLPLYFNWSRENKEKLFIYVVNTSLKKGMRANICVLCPYQVRSSFTMIVDEKHACVCCLICLHQLNLNIIYKRQTFEEIRVVQPIALA